MSETIYGRERKEGVWVSLPASDLRALEAFVARVKESGDFGPTTKQDVLRTLLRNFLKSQDKGPQP